MNTITKNLLLITILMFSGCIPQMEKGSGEVLITNTSADITAIGNELSKTSTGQQTVSDMTSLKNQGYTIQVYFVSTAELQAMNGHTGGGYKINGSVISIYINNGLSKEENAHVVAHEMIHVKDDLEIEQFLVQYPNVRSAAENFVRNYKTQSLSSFDQNAVSYVLGTLFCTETRAYTKNQMLLNEGLTTTQFAHTNLPQFIDENYIYKFGTRYGTSASSMASWCLNKNSMTHA